MRPELDHFANSRLLSCLGAHGMAVSAGTVIAVDGYEIHAHPDLAARLDEARPPGVGPAVIAFGIPVLLYNRIAFAFAAGTTLVALRLGDEVPDLVHSSLGEYATAGPDWHGVDAWQGHLTAEDGLRHLCEWVDRARRYVALL